MKKILTAVMVISLAVGMVGCASKVDAGTKVEDKQVEQSLEKDIPVDDSKEASEIEEVGELFIGKIISAKDNKVLVDGCFGLTGSVEIQIDENTEYPNGEFKDFPEGYLICIRYDGSKLVDGDTKKVTALILSSVEEDQVISIDDPIIEN